VGGRVINILSSIIRRNTSGETSLQPECHQCRIIKRPNGLGLAIFPSRVAGNSEVVRGKSCRLRRSTHMIA